MKNPKKMSITSKIKPNVGLIIEATQERIKLGMSRYWKRIPASRATGRNRIHLKIVLIKGTNNNAIITIATIIYVFTHNNGTIIIHQRLIIWCLQ